MGDPKMSRKQYETPTHPWQGPRIKDEAELVKKYGLKNKREVWKAQTTLRQIRGQARNLQALQGRDNPQAEKETTQLLERLQRVGMLQEGARLDDVLALNVEAVLNRRLQTQVYLKGLASTPQQARQFIVHGHVTIDGARVTIPGYQVRREEEPFLAIAEASPLADPAHPVRPRVDTGEVIGEVQEEDDEISEEAEDEPGAEAPGADEPQDDPEEEALEGSDEGSDGDSDDDDEPGEAEPEEADAHDGTDEDAPDEGAQAEEAEVADETDDEDEPTGGN